MDPVPGRKSEPSTPSERIEGKRRVVEWSQRRCVPLGGNDRTQTQRKLVVAVMDQSRTLACEVVDNGMVVKEWYSASSCVLDAREIFGCR